MQQSMTGYGRHQISINGLLVKTEVKTLNSKFLDFSPRIPRELSDWESEIRNIVSDRLKRGKVMLNIEIASGDESVEVAVNEVLFKAYYDKFKSMSNAVGGGGEDLVTIAIQSPEVIKPRELDPKQLPWVDIKKSVATAIDQCVTFREKEGGVLSEKMTSYVINIENGLLDIEQSDHKRKEAIRARIQKNLDDIRDRVQVDENRFEQELIFYLERMDISEEKVRLKQHLSYFNEIITKEATAGKKLGFISQEIGREINTIGSKANDAEMQRTVVHMKDELEKIKEQTLNLL